MRTVMHFIVIMLRRMNMTDEHDIDLTFAVIMGAVLPIYCDQGREHVGCTTTERFLNIVQLHGRFAFVGWEFAF